MTLLTIIVSCLLAQSTTSATTFTYPVFGTKRYHRSGATGAGGGHSLIAQQQQQLQSYYDEPSPVNYMPATYANQDYPADVDSSFYYMPRRESEYYGLPTYRGEYKPKPYYYAHGPSYSYYDDRNEQANPLDDLHDEMLQEDERERMRDQPQLDDSEWYDTASATGAAGSNSMMPSRPDKLTNAFLRNLILYNKEIAANKQQRKQYEAAAAAVRDYDEEYDDRNGGGGIAVSPADGEYYEPLEIEHLQMREQNRHQQQPQQRAYDSYDKYDFYDVASSGKKNQRKPSAATKTVKQSSAKDIEEDKDVQELKSLAAAATKAEKQQRRKQNREEKERQKQLKKQQKQRQQQLLKEQQEEERRQQLELERQQQRRLQLLQQQQLHAQTQPMYADYQQDNVGDYDSDSASYNDDDAWINWERKRSYVGQPLPIFGFDDRKPVPVQLTSSTTTSTQKPTATETSTTIKEQKPKAAADGQKEVVLPRPATPVRHPFSSPVMELLTHNAAVQDDDDEQDTKPATNVAGKSTVYDTIKQLLAMNKNLEKVSLHNKLCPFIMLIKEYLIYIKAPFRVLLSGRRNRDAFNFNIFINIIKKRKPSNK